ncbi:MAG: hypothetical protein IH784_02345 [Bacteroidetes bacterium]|nr:hypothetical protein [Bacteroidota bacterium]
MSEVTTKESKLISVSKIVFSKSEISEEVCPTEVTEVIRGGMEYNTNINAIIIIAPEITTLRPNLHYYLIIK